MATIVLQNDEKDSITCSTACARNSEPMTNNASGKSPSEGDAMIHLDKVKSNQVE